MGIFDFFRGNPQRELEDLRERERRLESEMDRFNADLSDKKLPRNERTRLEGVLADLGNELQTVQNRIHQLETEPSGDPVGAH